ncbi:Glyoxalase/Bleomycin resistance protein/Dioxygenase superfamily [Paraphoma chrysanthemicola]|nr:Glyoxalase/Bleomycin resistance protein/Dioxygenase superfamily [Paraphoma chrysanthemicola]
MHIAFECDNRATVDAFHAAALKAGGKCNGQPGLRHRYHSKPFAALVLDPMGNNVEILNYRERY